MLILSRRRRRKIIIKLAPSNTSFFNVRNLIIEFYKFLLSVKMHSSIGLLYGNIIKIIDLTEGKKEGIYAL